MRFQLQWSHLSPHQLSSPLLVEDGARSGARPGLGVAAHGLACAAWLALCFESMWVWKYVEIEAFASFGL